MQEIILTSGSFKAVVALLPARHQAGVEKQARGYRTRCWVWTGYTIEGYGAWYSGGAKRRVVNLAHRVVSAACHGPIKPKWEVDHLCRVRACIRPSHLEQVQAWQNRARANDVNQRRREYIGKGKGSVMRYARDNFNL